MSKDLREIIFQMVAENPTWGAPHIHGELLALGFDISERTVSQWVQRSPKDPERRDRWKTFLRNHREIIAATDFFAVPSSTSDYSTATSLPAMIVAKSFISMSRAIRIALGRAAVAVSISLWTYSQIPDL